MKTIRLPWRERGRLVDDAHGHRATDRALRIGQRRKVLVHRFVTRGTIEVDAQASVVEPLQRSWSGRPVGGRPRADNADSSESLNLCAELGQLHVDEAEHTGASVRAANWVRVGETCGRGDRTHAAPETRKAVYVYALEPAWRARLAVPAPGIAPLAAGDGLDAGSWADHEFGGAPLGAARLSARLVQSAQHMAQSPMRAITGATSGARALVKGHYRLIDQPAGGAVMVDNILEPHRERTLRRMRAHDTVLCIQNGTRLNFTRRSHTQGLGTIGSNQTGGRGPRPAPARDAGGQSRRGGTGRPAGRLRRARAPEP